MINLKLKTKNKYDVSFMVQNLEYKTQVRAKTRNLQSLREKHSLCKGLQNKTNKEDSPTRGTVKTNGWRFWDDLIDKITEKH